MASPRPGVRRWLLLTLSSLLCGTLSAIAAVLGQLWSLPTSDGAHGSSPLALLTDPLVLTMAPLVVVPAALLGLLAARAFLWKTRLEVTVPIVTAVSVLVCLLAGRLGFLVVVPALLAAFLAMVWCEERFPAGVASLRNRRLRALRSR